MAERVESIVIERLANGFRVDIISSLLGDPKPVRVGSVHYPDVTTARTFADMLQSATGIAISDKTEGAA